MIRTAFVVACVVATAGCALRGGTDDPQNRPVDPNKVAVYVFTAPRLNPAPLPDQVVRERMARRLAEELGGKRHVVVTDDRSDADVLAEVRSPASMFSPMDPRAVFDPNAWTVDLAAGELTARLTESTGFEDRTINKLAGAVDRWIQSNRASIVGARTPAR